MTCSLQLQPSTALTKGPTPEHHHSVAAIFPSGQNTEQKAIISGVSLRSCKKVWFRRLNSQRPEASPSTSRQNATLRNKTLSYVASL